MENLDMAIDFGGSGLKVVASYSDRVIAFRIAPQIIDISNPIHLEQEFSIDLTKNLWVGCPHAYYALGRLAATQYHATVPLVEPKKTYVIPRTLGAVAVAAHRFGIKKFKINLQLLLPAAEFSKEGKLMLSNELSSALALFESPIDKIKAKLFNFTAKPEGFGLMRRKMMMSGASYQQQDTAVVMFGHRNTSLYLLRGGEQTHYRSNNIGFVRAIESANVDQVDAIANPKLVDEASVLNYWKANQAWLRENWPKSATTAIVGGGPLSSIGESVRIYIDELCGKNRHAVTFLDGGMPLNYCDQNSEVYRSKDLNLPPALFAWPDDLGFSGDDKRQFADVYCLWATRDSQKKPAE